MKFEMDKPPKKGEKNKIVNLFVPCIWYWLRVFANINKPKENLKITMTTMFPLKKVGHPSHNYFQAYGASNNWTQEMEKEFQN
jgi:hypothetical protein